MKRFTLTWAVLLLVAQLFAACRGDEDESETPRTEQHPQSTESMNINIIIGSTTFPATIDDTETGRAFLNLLPLTLTMSELNGNEKYEYLSTSLPTDSYRPGTIEAGDLMLYGSSCVVLFYETFRSSYSYTRIGKLTNPDGLRQAVGSGSVSVRFERSTSGVESPRQSSSAPTEAYDQSGKRAEPSQKGIVIKDGKKILNP